MRGGPGFGRGFQEATMTRNNAPQAPTNSYATDGKCHNAEPGTYGHECGKPATWIGGKTPCASAAKRCASLSLAHAQNVRC